MMYGFCLFVWFGSLHPCQLLWSCQGRSVHPTTFFSWASLTKQLTSTSCTFFHLLLTTTFLQSSEGRRMAIELFHDQSQ